MTTEQMPLQARTERRTIEEALEDVTIQVQVSGDLTLEVLFLDEFFFRLYSDARRTEPVSDHHGYIVLSRGELDRLAEALQTVQDLIARIMS